MLTVAHLSHQYPHSVQASLDDLSLSVRPGEILGLLGPNGAGKTTLISHICGSLPIQQGEITVAGQPLAAARRSDPTRIAIAPQEYAFYPMLSVRENLQCFAAAARLRGTERAARVDACIAFAQLQAHAGQRAERLSGGLKRRLNLAIALLPRPDYLLLDEPTVGVDPQSRAFLLSVVKQLAADGVGVIYTSHYMEEIEALAQQVLIIDRGRTLLQGSLEQLLQTATERPLVQLGLQIEAAQAVALLQSWGDVTAQGDLFNVHLKAGVAPFQLFEALAQASVLVRQAQFGRQNLEQLFMSLTQRALRD